jgi:DNA modification methylase
MNEVIHGDCVEIMGTMADESIDLTVTSPPYDNLRAYKGYTFDFESIADELFRITKQGGVVVWVVGDATVKGSETGTSFRQALYFKEIGFNLHDTMIWEKTGRIPTQDRYYNVVEYMFVLSKGKPKAMNFITDHKCVNGGRKQRKDKIINKGKHELGDGYFIRNEYGRRSNIWKIHVGRNKTGHPAIFPEQLANDHISTWSNKGDVVFDPMCGSGTTLLMAKKNDRNYIGIDIAEEYVELSRNRLEKLV